MGHPKCFILRSQRSDQWREGQSPRYCYGMDALEFTALGLIVPRIVVHQTSSNLKVLGDVEIEITYRAMLTSLSSSGCLLVRLG